MDIDTILKQLTPEEKAALLQGWTQWTTLAVPRLKIPSLFLADGPHGLCKQTEAEKLLWSRDTFSATCFPTAATMANAWDPELGEALGRALGEEAAAADVHVVLGPGLNMKRSPLCGRNFEYFSEDPYLAGKMAAAYIRGIQASGSAACPKHFAVNSQETLRMCSDSVIDERSLREIYLTAFEIAVKEGRPKAIMSSYNRVNGIYANENPHLLTDILRREWGFDGFVVTDWGADNDHAAGVAAGSNLVMPAPGPDEAIRLLQALEEGRITEQDIDCRLRELLQNALEIHSAVASAPKHYDANAHHALARKCASESIVLLENDGILPLRAGARVALIGDFAKTPRYQGAGSSLVKPTKLESLSDCIAASELNLIGYAPGYRRDKSEADPALIAEAAALAERADVVLLCVGLDETTETEGMDRTDLMLSAGHYALIEAISCVNANVVLVLSGGAPFTMPNKRQYRAAIHGYLGGQAGASAMLDALMGKVNPCGKLSESWPLQLEDTPCHACYPSEHRTAEYREGLFIGYRYYDTAEVSVRYPFGHGLSYTNFAYSDLQVSEKEISFTLQNIGSCDGAEIAQVYIGCCDAKLFRPKKELKGFAKIFLRAGESRRVTIPLDDKAFRYFNPATNAWEIEGGPYEISVAASVLDVRLSQLLPIAGTNAPNPYDSLPRYKSGKVTDVPDTEFSALLGRPIPERNAAHKLGPNDAIRHLDRVGTLPARLLHHLVYRMAEKGAKKSPPDLNILFVYNMPFRGIAKLTGGMFTAGMVDDLVLALDGHFFRGTGRLVRDFLRNKKAGRAFARKLKRTE